MKPSTRVRKNRRGKTAGRKATAGRVLKPRATTAGGKRSRDPIAEIGELYRPIKKPVTLRLDADVLAWFKRQGHGYQTRINRALRKMMMGERKSSGG
jgi:uncharacterized protein (DUF4415 family)